MSNSEAFSVVAFDGTVDPLTETIHGVKVMQLGRVNDWRPLLIDMETLKQVVYYGNRPNKGVKCRYTHAAVQGDGETIGTHLGRWTNFRIDNDCVRADLSIAKSSHLSPKGDIGGYVLSVTVEDPEAIGASVHGDFDEELMRESASEGLMPVRYQGLYSVDIVGEPAATRGGLFSCDKEEQMADAVAEPEKKEEDYSFLASEDMAPEDKVKKVAEMLGVDMPSDEEEEPEKEEEAMASEEPAPEEKKKEEAMSKGHEPFVEAFGALGAQWFLEGKSLVECFKVTLDNERKLTASLSQKITELESKVKAVDYLRGHDSPLSESFAKKQEKLEVSPEEALKKARETKVTELVKQGVDEKTARWTAAFSVTKP